MAVLGRLIRDNGGRLEGKRKRERVVYETDEEVMEVFERPIKDKKIREN